MPPAHTIDWHEANTRYLAARLDVVRAALMRHAGVSDIPDDATLARAVDDAAAQLTHPAALDTVCAAFGLSPFERDVLLLCAGADLDASFHRIYATAGNDRAQPTFSLALAALPDAHWGALAPGSPLRQWHLIELGAADNVTTAPLRIDERVLHYLAGVASIDERIQSLTHAVAAGAHLPPSHRAIAETIAALWRRTAHEAPPVVHLVADERDGALDVAAAAASAVGLDARVIDGADIPSSPAERDTLARLWEREAVLARCALVIECDEHDVRAARAMLEQTRGCLIVRSRESIALRRAVVRFELDVPDAVAQRAQWRAALGPSADALNGALDRLVDHFRLRGDEIAAAAAHAMLDSDDAHLAERLWTACRVSARTRLDALAERITPRATWDDLVLPPSVMQLLRDIAAQVRNRMQVYDSWGFAAKESRGLGITALFSGASGTGKTMAAEVIAGDLGIDCYRIDLSQVVSKYIGETEKNLRRVFDAAEAGGAVLLFDEADALFGKRSDVKDSHDRYANIEVSYLLQRMESYRGLAILTTNMKTVIDGAFLRRLRFIVSFPFPDAAQRADIWRRVFPSATPTENLDIAKLARLNVTGGNIHAIALQAAFLAAELREPVRMGHLLRAARNEYAKTEKPLADSEVAGWH